MGSKHKWPCWLFWQPAISTLLVVIKFCSVLSIRATSPKCHLRADYFRGRKGAEFIGNKHTHTVAFISIYKHSDRPVIVVVVVVVVGLVVAVGYCKIIFTKK